MSVNFLAEANRTNSILHTVGEYCDDCMYDSVAQLTLEDLDYLAQELDTDFTELVAILRESI